MYMNLYIYIYKYVYINICYTYFICVYYTHTKMCAISFIFYKNFI